MVIIASIIGGTADIGWEVLSTMRKAQFGESLLAGIVIALMAMVMDRITAAARHRGATDPAAGSDFLARHRNAVSPLGLGWRPCAGAQVFPLLKEYPEAWEVYPAQYLNDAVTWLVVEHAKTINLIKSWAFFFVMLPVKTGFEQTVTPFTWGFEFTAPLKNGYALLAAALVVYTAVRRGVGRASLIAFLAILLFYGITRLPWPALLAMAAVLGWQLGGLRLALGTRRGSDSWSSPACGPRPCSRSTCAGWRCCSRSRSESRSGSWPRSTTECRRSCVPSTTRCRPCRCS